MIFLLFLSFIVVTTDALDYYGRYCGAFSHPSVRGEVYLVNSTHLQIVGFQSSSSDAQSFALIADSRKSTPKVYQYLKSPGGEWLKTSSGSLENQVHKNSRLVLEIDGSAAQQISVIDKNGKVLASVGIDKTPPKPFCCFERVADMGLFGEYGIMSDPIAVLDSRTLRIPNFSYKASETPDGYFFAGTGPDIDKKTGKKAMVVGKDTENKICPMLTDIVEKDMIVRLDESQTIYDIEWLSVFCYQYSHDFGHLDLGLVEDEELVPPFIPEIRHFAPQKIAKQSC